MDILKQCAGPVLLEMGILHLIVSGVHVRRIQLTVEEKSIQKHGCVFILCETMMVRMTMG